MPIYEYECPKCGSFEHSQSIHDRPLHKCPKCRRKVQRLISSTSFHLKGGGWYAHGYQKGGSSEAKSAETSSSAGTAAPSKPSEPTTPAKSTTSSGDSSSS